MTASSTPTKRSVTHATFTLERVYDASPARVFKAFADQSAKARWFASAEGWNVEKYTLDFRVGGQEIWRGGPQGGPVHHNNTVYQDIVPNQRIIYTYEMYLGDQRISVSVVTVQMAPEGTRTRLTFTEQGAFLDGFDDPSLREHGTRELLESLALELQREPAQA